jgi:hypothetical protein
MGLRRPGRGDAPDMSLVPLAIILRSKPRPCSSLEASVSKVEGSSSSSRS